MHMYTTRALALPAPNRLRRRAQELEDQLSTLKGRDRAPPDRSPRRPERQDSTTHPECHVQVHPPAGANSYDHHGPVHPDHHMQTHLPAGANPHEHHGPVHHQSTDDSFYTGTGRSRPTEDAFYSDASGGADIPAYEQPPADHSIYEPASPAPKPTQNPTASTPTPVRGIPRRSVTFADDRTGRFVSDVHNVTTDTDAALSPERNISMNKSQDGTVFGSPVTPGGQGPDELLMSDLNQANESWLHSKMEAAAYNTPIRPRDPEERTVAEGDTMADRMIEERRAKAVTRVTELREDIVQRRSALMAKIDKHTRDHEENTRHERTYFKLIQQITDAEMQVVGSAASLMPMDSIRDQLEREAVIRARGRSRLQDAELVISQDHGKLDRNISELAVLEQQTDQADTSLQYRVSRDLLPKASGESRVSKDPLVASQMRSPTCATRSSPERPTPTRSQGVSTVASRTTVASESTERMIESAREMRAELDRVCRTPLASKSPAVPATCRAAVQSPTETVRASMMPSKSPMHAAAVSLGQSLTRITGSPARITYPSKSPSALARSARQLNQRLDAITDEAAGMDQRRVQYAPGVSFAPSGSPHYVAAAPEDAIISGLVSSARDLSSRLDKESGDATSPRRLPTEARSHVLESARKLKAMAQDIANTHHQRSISPTRPRSRSASPRRPHSTAPSPAPSAGPEDARICDLLASARKLASRLDVQPASPRRTPHAAAPDSELMGSAKKLTQKLDGLTGGSPTRGAFKPIHIRSDLELSLRSMREAVARVEAAVSRDREAPKSRPAQSAVLANTSADNGANLALSDLDADHAPDSTVAPAVAVATLEEHVDAVGLAVRVLSPASSPAPTSAIARADLGPSMARKRSKSALSPVPLPTLPDVLTKPAPVVSHNGGLYTLYRGEGGDPLSGSSIGSMSNGAVSINGTLYILYKPLSAADAAPETTIDQTILDPLYQSVGMAGPSLTPAQAGSPLQRSQALPLSPRRQSKAPFDALREYDMGRDREYYGRMLDRSIRLSPKRPYQGGVGAAPVDAGAANATFILDGHDDADDIDPSARGVAVAADPVVCADAVLQAERQLDTLKAKAQRLLDALEVEAVNV